MSSTLPNIESLQTRIESFRRRRLFPSGPHQVMEELEKLRTEASADPEGFWARMAEELHWFKKWDRVLNWQPPHAEWFVGGKLNISYNCLDRHLGTWRRNKAALIWEGEPGDQRTLTYQQLHTEVCKFANVLKRSGVEQGDRVALYMPLIPELAILDAGVRAHRRYSLGDLRRVLEHCAGRSHQRCEMQSCSHR
jgi:acetyl-CoA synthetase